MVRADLIRRAVGVLRSPQLERRDDLLANALNEARMGWLRIPLLLACGVGLASVLPLTTALTWTLTATAFEAFHRFACFRAVNGAAGGRELFFTTSVIASILWTGSGVLLWLQGSNEAQAASVAAFMAIALYTAAFSHQSATLLAAVMAPPLLARLLAGAVLVQSRPPGPATLLLNIMLACGVIVLLGAAVACHLNYAKMWDAREKLADERDALEKRVAERTEELTRARARAEAANIAKSQFLANMSHELRTPLNAVIGYAEILDEDLEAQGGQEALRADAQRIRSSGRHLLKLVNDVLDISKIEANRLEIDAEFLDVGRVLRDVADSLRHSAEERGNRIDVKVSADLGPVWADSLRLHQCVLNLASNACKFTKQGLVSISAERCDDERGAWICIRVRDTGIGIDAEAITKLFKPFVQADVTTTRRFGGTGLGLSITRELARLMGGDVAVESVVGAGSTFTLILPHRSESESAKPASGTHAA
ncbi:MAG TPA: ATP-binding protein [Caulobacterales bacterium]|nr:ATP-binding protein [Caulobacterales bacterium]